MKAAARAVSARFGRPIVTNSTRAAIAVAGLAVVAALVLSGCVYYNTFYHAKAAYAEAESMRSNRAPDSDPSSQEIELLDRVIEKSGRVLRLHPESDWADDALLLLATALYHQGKYETAETRLTEFSRLYPDSDLAPEAGYLLGAVMLARDNPVSAEQTLEDLAYSDPPADLSDDAMMMIGRARHSRRRYDGAAEAYLTALERFPNSELRAEIRFLAAENYVAMGKLEDAAHQLALVSEERGARQLAFEARVRLAEVSIEMGRLDEALEVLAELEYRTTDRDDLDRVLLLRGRTLDLRGDLEDAISTYAGIAASHQRSEAAAEALYRIGLIRRDDYGSFDEAIESFRQAKDEGPRTEVARRATDAIRDVENLKQALDAIERWRSGADAKADTTEALSEDQSQFVTVLDDSLLSQTGEEAADTTALAVADTVALAVGDTTALAVGDTTALAAADTVALAAADTAALALADTVALAVADTVALAVADTTALAVAEPDTVVTPDVARAMFRAGEIYLFKMDDAERAIEHYSMVVENFGGTRLGPKAALAAAWARDNVLGQAMRAAEAYRLVVERYPGTKYAEEALEALGEEPEAGADEVGSDEVGSDEVGSDEEAP